MTRFGDPQYGPGMQNSWIFIVAWFSRIVLLLLVLLSVWSVAVIIDRRKFFRGLGIEENFEKLRSRFLSGDAAQVRAGLRETPSVYTEAFEGVVGLQEPEQIEKALSAFVLTHRTRWEQGLPVLGTLGAITPFIGLLGTILGIIVAFGELSSGSMDSLKIMYALAEALILTAVGLAVAIPAVVANNHFNRRITVLVRNIEALKDSLRAFVLRR